MFLAVRLLGAPDELLHPHELTLALVRPDTPNPEHIATARIEAQPPIVPTPSGEAQVAFPILVRFSASVFAVYAVQVGLNGEQQAVRFAVRPASEQPAA